MKIKLLSMFFITILLLLSGNYFHANSRQIDKVDEGSISSANKNSADESARGETADIESLSLKDMVKKNPVFFGFIIIIAGSLSTLVLILLSYLFFRLSKSKKK